MIIAIASFVCLFLPSKVFKFLGCLVLLWLIFSVLTGTSFEIHYHPPQ
jgi:hypothetical protein